MTSYLNPVPVTSTWSTRMGLSDSATTLTWRRKAAPGDTSPRNRVGGRNETGGTTCIRTGIVMRSNPWMVV